MEVKYSRINNGWLVVIELANNKIIHDRFRDLNVARMWAHSFCEGYAEAMIDVKEKMRRAYTY